MKTASIPVIMSNVGRMTANHPLMASAAVVGGVGMADGAQKAMLHNTQTMQQIEANKEDLSVPAKKYAEALTTQRSYLDKFASERRTQKTASPINLATAVGGSAISSIATPFIDALITKPLNKAYKIFDQKMYIEPRQENVFKQAVNSDPILARAMQDNPQLVAQAYSTLKHYAPTFTADVSALRGYLRQIVITGAVDPATIRLIAETEKLVLQSRNQIRGP